MIKQVKGGYKATTKEGKELSKKPKTKLEALKQLKAAQSPSTCTPKIYRDSKIYTEAANS